MEIWTHRTTLILIAFTVVLFAMQANVALSTAEFAGDAGYRMINSDSIGVRLGNRVWLPVLQSHIWALHHADFPLWTYRLIAPFYFSIAVFTLGLITIRFAGRTTTGLISAGFLMLCFASQVHHRAITLYQEILGAAWFYLLVTLGALELKKDVRLIVIGAIAIMTRDDFWIYLLVLTALNFRLIMRDRDYLLSFGFLWSVVALWFVSIFAGYRLIKGRFPSVPLEWPLMINKGDNQAVSSVSSSFDSLMTAASRINALWLITAVIFVWLIAAVFFRNGIVRLENKTPRLSNLCAFSLVSLLIIYGLILLLDPWQATPGNTRMMYPFLEHAYLWIAISAGLGMTFSPLLRLIAGVIVSIGIIFGSGLSVSTWIPRDTSETHFSNTRLEQYLTALSPTSRITVCTAGDDYWSTVRRFSGPTRKELLRSLGKRTDPSKSSACAVILTRAEVGYDPGRQFIRVDEYSIDGHSVLAFQNLSLQAPR